MRLRDRAIAVPIAVLLLLYGSAYLLLMWVAGGLPYVMDNNESFSSLWHAANLYNHPFTGSFGLTDESYGTTVASHPYVYTHQGNFPRLFAYLIYVLGARSVESQILVTTLVAGGAAVVLAYVFFARFGSRLFALLCCIVLISDYLLVAQWQVVTYRVWHEFFVFSSLLCVYAVGHGAKSLRWLVVANFACLFYYEFVFVAFVSLCALLFATYVHWRQWKHIVELGVLIAIGGAFAIALLAVQLIAHMGWEDFVRDTYLTFIARNRFRTDPSLLREMVEFFDSRNIVFWYNLEDGSRFRTLPFFIASITYYEFQIHTPFFTTVIFIIGAAVVVGLIHHLLSGRQASARLTFVCTAAVSLALLHLVHSGMRGSFGMLQIGPIIVAGLLWITWSVKTSAAALRARRFLAWLPPRRRSGILDFALWALVPSVLLHESGEASIFGRYSPLYMAFLLLYLSVLCFLLYSNMKLANAHFKLPVALPPSLVHSVGLVVIAAGFFAIAKSIQREQVLGVASIDPMVHEDVLIALGALVGAAIVVLALLAPSRSQSPSAGSVHRSDRVAASALFVAIAAAIATWNPAVYHQTYVPLWRFIIAELRFSLWIAPALALALVVGMRIAVVHPARHLPFLDGASIQGIGAFFLTGLLAYILTFAIFAAYIFTGYRFRLAPFTVFHTDPLIAFAVLAVIGVCLDALRRCKTRINARRAGSLVPLRAIALDAAYAVASSALLILICVYWFGTQAVYTRLFPPNHYSVLTLLEEKYKYATTMTNTYAAPIAWATKNWSYLHAGTITMDLQKDGSRYALAPDGTYMWFADRRSNPSYRRPDYYVCIAVQAPFLAVQVMNWRSGRGERVLGCDGDLLVQESLKEASDTCPPLKLAEIDDEGREAIGYPRWAIVRLDWDSADSSCTSLVDNIPIQPILPGAAPR